jgi:hypothetical protein
MSDEHCQSWKLAMVSSSVKRNGAILVVISFGWLGFWRFFGVDLYGLMVRTTPQTVWRKNPTPIPKISEMFNSFFVRPEIDHMIHVLDGETLNRRESALSAK